MIGDAPRGLGPCSGYFPAFDTNATLGLSAGVTQRELLMQHHRSRLRDDQTIKGVKLFVGSLTGFTSIKIRVWRWISGTSYQLIGSSENLLSKLLPQLLQEVTFDTPIAGCAEGDYPSIVIEGAAGSTGLLVSSAAAGGLGTVWFTNAVPASPFAWEAASSLLNQYVQFQLITDSPDFIFGGDSHSAGRYGHTCFAEDVTAATDHSATDIAGQWPRQYRNLSGHSYQCLGIGGETSAQTLARFQALLDLKPHAIVLHSAWNGIRFDTATPAQIAADWTAMAALAAAEGVLLFNFEGSPLDGETNLHHQQFDAYTALVKAIPSTGKYLYVPQRQLTGKFRAGGDAGNLWDWLPGMAGPDLLHPTNLAKAAMAQALWDLIEPLLLPGARPRTSPIATLPVAT